MKHHVKHIKMKRKKKTDMKFVVYGDLFKINVYQNLHVFAAKHLARKSWAPKK